MLPRPLRPTTCVHHLRADHDGDVLAAEALEERLMRAHGRNAVRIHAEDLRAGEKLVQLLLDALSARSEIAQLSPAFGAGAVDRAGMPAVVTHQAAVGAVIGQRHAAVRTLVGVAAVGTADELVRAAAIDEQDALLAAFQVLLDLRAQRFADISRVAAAQLPLHVHDADLGQLKIVVALVQREIGVATDLRVIARLDVRRCGAEDEQRARAGTEIFCHITRVITRRIL